MPKIVKHRHWTIRIDLLPGVAEVLRDYCVKLPALICCQEVGTESEKDHVHILTSFSEPVAHGDLTKQFKSHFNHTVFAKSNFAFSVWDTHDSNNELQEYVCKGPSKTDKTPPIVLYKQWLEDENEHHENYWVKHRKIMAKNTKKQVKELDKFFVVNKVYDSVDSDRTDFATEHGYEPSQTWIFDRIKNHTLRYYLGKLNDHVAFPVVQAVLYKFYPHVVQEAFSRRMDEKFKFLNI